MSSLLRKQALPGIGRSIIQILGSSLNWRIEDPYDFLNCTDHKPYLVTFWHNRILMIPHLYSQILPHRRAKTLISPSRDGEWITSIIEQFGFSAIRGSTSKNGAAAFRELLQVIKKGDCDIGITPDGPRGPVYKVQPGVIRLSQLTGRPILPVTYHLEHKIELKSWDCFQIPLPLSLATLVIGKPRVIPRDLSEEEVQKEVEELERILGK